MGEGMKRAFAAAKLTRATNPVARVLRQPGNVETLTDALAIIARGRTDNGRPIAAEAARQAAREALIEFGSDWK